MRLSFSSLLFLLGTAACSGGVDSLPAQSPAQCLGPAEHIEFGGEAPSRSVYVEMNQVSLHNGSVFVAGQPIYEGGGELGETRRVGEALGAVLGLGESPSRLLRWGTSRGTRYTRGLPVDDGWVFLVLETADEAWPGPAITERGWLVVHQGGGWAPPDSLPLVVEAGLRADQTSELWEHEGEIWLAGITRDPDASIGGPLLMHRAETGWRVRRVPRDRTFAVTLAGPKGQRPFLIHASPGQDGRILIEAVAWQEEEGTFVFREIVKLASAATLGAFASISTGDGAVLHWWERGEASSPVILRRVRVGRMDGDLSGWKMEEQAPILMQGPAADAVEGDDGSVYWVVDRGDRREEGGNLDIGVQRQGEPTIRWLGTLEVAFQGRHRVLLEEADRLLILGPRQQMDASEAIVRLVGVRVQVTC